MKNLLVVDTPTKARTVWLALNQDSHDTWVVLDYPVPPTEFSRKSAGGINSDAGFEPSLTPVNKDRLSRIIEVCKEVDTVYLCFDPTIEGEETSVFLLNAVSPYIDFSKVHRIRFGYLTKKSIHKAIEKEASFDHFSSEKSENLRLLDRMVHFNVNSALGGKSVYEADVGLCGYYIMSLLCARHKERREHVQKLPEFRVAFRARNGSIVKSEEQFFQSGANSVAEVCMNWLRVVHKLTNVTGEDVTISPPTPYDLNSLVLDCVSTADLRLSFVVDNIISMYHEGLITNPFVLQKIPAAYGANVIEYLKSFDMDSVVDPPSLQGIVPIDIHLDMNKLNKSYRPIYRKIWQRTMQAYGTETQLRKTYVKFMVSDGKLAGGDRFYGSYCDVIKSGHAEFFNKIRRDIAPDYLEEVLLEKCGPTLPEYYTEEELVAQILPLFSVFEIKNSLEFLRQANFLRTGTSTFFIPTFRGLILSFAVFKHLPQLGQVTWLKDMLEKVGQPKQVARAALADAWQQLKPEIQSLDKHKFVCEQCCPKCKTSLDVVFDKEKEPYLFCKKTSTSGCGAVHPILVTETGNIIVFEPYPVSRPCPKCELSTMRCYNGPYGLFVRCDKCGKTQPFE